MKTYLSNIKNISKKIQALHVKDIKYIKLGVFGGVFTPDVLSILGVILYLSLGLVVGNAGFLGTVAIIMLAKSITLCIALSMSSVTTNIKIGAGGVYSIISKSLGLEAGGSIGIPFYISQKLSAALYIVGFTEAWLPIFPEHPALIISIASWSVLLIISYISARFANRIQFIILGFIVLSIIFFFLTPGQPASSIPLIGEFSETLQRAPKADINIFGLAEALPSPFMREAPELTESSCLFIKDLVRKVLLYRR